VGEKAETRGNVLLVNQMRNKEPEWKEKKVLMNPDT
jgi:hypothetical protein